MAKPTLAAQLELANAKLAMAEAKIEELRAFARNQKTTIAALRGEVTNLQEAAEVLPAPQRAAGWAPSARLLAAKARAMADIASLEGHLANKAEAKAAWAPSARLLAAKARAMADGRCVKA